MKVTAFVPAAGQGARVGADRNKVLLPLLDVPVIVWTLRALQTSPVIANVVLIVRPQDTDDMVALTRQHDLSKVTEFAPGGPERQDSVYNGLTTARAIHDIVLIHDAARPFASSALIAAVCQAAGEAGAAIAAIPVADTLMRTDAARWAVETVPRADLWRVQTPQAFQRDLIVQAHRQARADKFAATDDASLVRRYGGRVQIVPGETANFKLTDPADFGLAEALLRHGRCG